MKITYVVDGRSPIAQSWIENSLESGNVVQVLSTYPVVGPAQGQADFRVLPTLTSRRPALAARSLVPRATAARNRFASRRPQGGQTASASRLPDLLFRARVTGEIAHRRSFARAFHAALDEFRPDLVHALRIPFEAALAAQAMPSRPEPFVVSVWGNDLTYQPLRSPRLARETVTALQRAHGLVADCRRDIRCAVAMGYESGRPTHVIPGSGGLDLERFSPGPRSAELLRRFGIPAAAPVVLNPRGFRAYVDNDTFVNSIPLVLAHEPGTVFLLLGMSGSRSVQRHVEELRVGSAVRLLPNLAFHDMPDLFRLADVVVSPSLHDGTPNTLLEAMACGAVPVLVDIPSVREWIEPDLNGLLIQPTTPANLADATVRVIKDDCFAARARAANLDVVRERADRLRLRAPLNGFYLEVMAGVGC